eukprot:1180529-Prorocentrum_minimum.AAC.1
MWVWVRMCGHGAVGVGCGGVCACVGKELQVWWGHGGAGVGVCAHVCAGTTGLWMLWGCVPMCRHRAVGVGVCAHAQQARGCGCGGVRACAGTGLQVRECVPMCRPAGAAGVGVCAQLRMCRHGAAGAGVCAHVQARGCRPGAAGVGVCAHVQARGCRHGAVGAGACAHVQARGCRCGSVCPCAGPGGAAGVGVCRCPCAGTGL